MKRAIVLLLIIGFGTAAPGYCPALERGAVVIGSRVQMHESPAGDSRAVGLLNEGVAVTLIGRKPTPDRIEGFSDYWYHVSYRGAAGWVFGQFIAPSTEGRGLARIYTVAELIDYTDNAVKNLVAVRNAGYYAALVDGSGRFLADLTELSEDSILREHAGRIEPYRLFAACFLAIGYAGTGDIAGAGRIRDELSAANPGALLPDGSTLGQRLADLDEAIGRPTEPSP